MKMQAMVVSEMQAMRVCAASNVLRMTRFHVLMWVDTIDPVTTLCWPGLFLTLFSCVAVSGYLPPASQVACVEDGRHYRPNHHAMTARFTAD